MSMYEVGTKFIRIRTEQHYVIEKIELSRVKGKLFKKEALFHLKQENGTVDLIVHESELKKLFKCVKQTNADHIRSMSDDELTDIILCPYDTAGKPANIMPCVRDGIQELVSPEYCKKCMMDWLQQEVEE